MRHFQILPVLLFALSTANLSLANDISDSIARQFKASRGARVDLALAYPAAWDRVCVLGPYADDGTARRALGFDWSAETKSSIHYSDTISVLVFVRANEVVSYVEHPRNKGDFSNLSEHCYARAKAVFRQLDHPDHGWAGLFASPGA